MRNLSYKLKSSEARPAFFTILIMKLPLSGINLYQVHTK